MRTKEEREKYYLSLSKDWWSLTTNERRTLRQADIFRKWRESGARGYISAVTGFGKSRLMSLAIAELYKRNSERIANVVVPHNAAKEVALEIKEELGVKRIRVITAQSYFQMEPHQRKATLLILDEGHRFTQEEGQLFNKVIDGTDFRFVMILSATFSPEQCKFMEDRGVPLIDEVTMEEAEECEYIAKLSKKVVYCNLFGESLRALNEVDEHYASSWSIFENKWNMVQNCLKPTEEGELARNYISRLKKIPPQNLFGLARTAMNAMSQRREFLQKASYKFDIIKDICELHKGQNIVTFGEHTDFVDQITDMLGKKARSYHSNVKSKKTTVTKTKLFKTERGVTSFVNKNKGKLALLEWEYDGGWYIAKWKVKKPVSGAKLKEQSMRDFETPGHPVTVLNTAKGLDEAANIKNVSVGIIWSFSSNPRQLTQRIGRICRWLEGKTAYVYVIVVKRSSAETQEQKWFRRATGYKEWDVLNDYELKRNVSPASGTN